MEIEHNTLPHKINSQIKSGIIVCWFGKLPEYFNIWLKSCSYNSDFDFLCFTDQSLEINCPKNVHLYSLSFIEFKEKVKKIVIDNPNINKPYRVCDFRPMFGILFKNELASYDFWGYCDIDVVFGKLNMFLSNDLLKTIDAVFNGGHLTLIRNCIRMNNLYKENGALFDYKTVTTKDSIFAFDEITGIQNIARSNNVNAIYSIPYIEAEIRYEQLRSRMDKFNPNNQVYYWERGELYRVKFENGMAYYQLCTYIHLQKRKLCIHQNNYDINDNFWILSDGFECKKYDGKPVIADIFNKNPYKGIKKMGIENIKYKFRKILEIIKRNPYQIYVRILQQKSGINRYLGTLEERPWERY